MTDLKPCPMCESWRTEAYADRLLTTALRAERDSALAEVERLHACVSAVQDNYEESAREVRRLQSRQLTEDELHGIFLAAKALQGRNASYTADFLRAIVKRLGGVK